MAFTSTLASLLVSYSTRTAILRSSTVRLLSSSSNHDDHEFVHSIQHDDTTFATLAKNRKTLKRLGPMVTLATKSSLKAAAADIGCDHGLLSYALAATGHFETVLGVDVSQAALEQGALALLQAAKVRDGESSSIPSDGSVSSSTEGTAATTKIKFLVGNGLEPLLVSDTEPAAAVDTVCLAGMGVNTMMDILEPSQLDTIRCQQIVVQPTNSRPRHMMKLYQYLQHQGFVVEQEHMVFLSRRWYLSTLFQKTMDNNVNENTLVLPAQTLESSSSSRDGHADDQEQNRLYQAYVDHHLEWLKRDQEQTGVPPRDIEDRQWLDAILKSRRKQ